MSRCTLATAANAESTAASSSDRGRPEAPISTNVPRSGRARRRLSGAIAIERDDPLDALGDVQGRERGAGDVADVAADAQRARARLADELPEPAPVPDLPAIGFAVLQDLDPLDAPARVERNRIVDVEMLADHTINDEESQDLAAGLRLPGAAVDDGEMRRRGECLLLRLLDGEILHRIGRRCDRDDRGCR